jgi:hypothetical protein
LGFQAFYAGYSRPCGYLEDTFSVQLRETNITNDRGEKNGPLFHNIFVQKPFPQIKQCKSIYISSMVRDQIISFQSTAHHIFVFPWSNFNVKIYSLTADYWNGLHNSRHLLMMHASHLIQFTLMLWVYFFREFPKLRMAPLNMNVLK